MNSKKLAMFTIAAAVVTFAIAAIGTGGLLVQHANAAGATVIHNNPCTSPFGTGTGVKVFTPGGKDILTCHVG